VISMRDEHHQAAVSNFTTTATNTSTVPPSDGNARDTTDRQSGIQKEKTRTGKGRASSIMKESRDNLLQQLTNTLLPATPGLEMEACRSA
jgi:hypothetical protein